MLVGSEGILKGSAIVLFLAAFSYEWTIVHSALLREPKKSVFRRGNGFEKYQPRARTIGHLFRVTDDMMVFCVAVSSSDQLFWRLHTKMQQPEPPTPAPLVKITEGVDPGRRTAVENANFNALRDSHYENMFAHAIKMKKEMEAMEREGNYGGMSAAASAATNGGEAVAHEVGTDGAAANDESIELSMASASSKDNKEVPTGGHKEA